MTPDHEIMTAVSRGWRSAASLLMPAPGLPGFCRTSVCRSPVASAWVVPVDARVVDHPFWTAVDAATIAPRIG